MWCLCCWRYIAKKKKKKKEKKKEKRKEKENVIEEDAEDINWEVVVASKAIDEGPWPKMTTYVTIPYCTCYLSLLIWCRKKTLLSTNFKIGFFILFYFIFFYLFIYFNSNEYPGKMNGIFAFC